MLDFYEHVSTLSLQEKVNNLLIDFWPSEFSF
jgi:hypothetical protein